MEQIFSILGFTDTVSTIWNVIGYVGMIAIIVGVLSGKLRNQLLFWGPLILVIYAWLFLHDPVLVGLQLVVTTSGALNLLNIKKLAPLIIIVFSAIIFIVLLLTGQISGLWSWLGALGLWGIALGFTQLPHKRAFTLMALGGLFIIIYSYAFQVWIFFILNIFFFIANIRELKRPEIIK